MKISRFGLMALTVLMMYSFAFQFGQKRRLTPSHREPIHHLYMSLEEVDVAVLGAGVGGCTISWMLAEPSP